MMTVRNLAPWLVAGTVAAWPALAAAQQPDSLAKAHDLYNQRQFDQAILAASEARQLPALADAAAVVQARAHLERYRLNSETADLDAARETLRPLESAKFADRARLDWTIAMGQLLYFDRRFGTAAEFFEAALARVDTLEPAAREWLLDWWAGALDQEAQVGPEPERRPIYTRIQTRAEDELRRDDRSMVASYWLSAAAVGVGDLDRAWAAAEAGWIRSSSGGAPGVRLRADLDRLVSTVIIPERVRRLSITGDPKPAMALLQQNWEEMKGRYGR